MPAAFVSPAEACRFAASAPDRAHAILCWYMPTMNRKTKLYSIGNYLALPRDALAPSLQSDRGHGLSQPRLQDIKYILGR